MHWPEGLRTRNDFLRRVLLVFAWPAFLDLLADDIRAWRQFVHVHTFNEDPPEVRHYLECAELARTIGDVESQVEYLTEAELKGR
jgi:hypothetical protein